MLNPIHAKPIATAVWLIVFLLIAPVVSAETISLEYGCTLNDAIRSAMTDTSVGGCRAGDPGRDHIYVVENVKIVEPPVEITEDISIVGDRLASTLDGQGMFSFFSIAPGVTVSLQDFIMSNGYGTGNSGQIRVGSGGRLHFNTANIIDCKGVQEIVAPADALVSIGHASSVCGQEPQFYGYPPVIAPQSGKPDSGRHKSGPKGKSAARTVVKPAVYTCESLPDHILVRPVAGTRSGIQCQLLDEAGVGIQNIIDEGIIAAVDIWGFVEPGVEVCLRGQGSLVFLDAAFAPRHRERMPSYREGDMTCAWFNRPGSLILV